MARNLRFKSQLFALGLGISLFSARNAGAAEPVDLSWQAPPECPGREIVLARMQAMLGASWAKLTPLRAAGVIERRATDFELRLSIDDGRGGERQLTAPRCEDLSGVAAVALVLLITTRGHLDNADLSSSGQEPGGAAQEPKKESPATTTTADADGANEPDEKASPQRLRWLVDAPLFALGLGPLPKPYPALGLGLGIEYGALSARVIGQWGMAQEIPASRAGYGVEVRRAAVGLWGCAEIGGPSLSVAPCLQASLTHVFGRGYGPSLRSASQTETSAAVGVGALGRWRIHDRLALLLGGGAQVELSRPLLVLEPLGTVEQLAPFSVTLLLGPEWIF